MTRRFDDNAAAVHATLDDVATLPIPIELMRRGNYTELNAMINGEWRRVGRSMLGFGTMGFAITSGARDAVATATIGQVRSGTRWSRLPSIDVTAAIAMRCRVECRHDFSARASRS